MQEDNTSKWLASLLRKQQEENQLPYEIGAWEAFEKKRAAKVRVKTGYWISGIAASLALFLIAGGLFLSQDTPTDSTLLSDQTTVEENVGQMESPRNTLPQISEDKTDEEIQIPILNSKEQAKKENFSTEGTSEPRNSSLADKKTSVSIANEKEDIKVQVPKQEFTADVLDQKAAEKEIPEQKSIASVTTPKSDLKQSLIASEEKGLNDLLQKSTTLEKPQTVVDLPKEPVLSEAEIAEVLETKTITRMAMGLSPGYGSSQGSGQITSGSSLGLGLMIDREVVGKLVMGSGVAVNYLNQASENQSYAQVAGFSSAVTQRDEIAQVQVDIPFYFKYPITQNQSISVQAGFSNLVTFNQSAETQSSYTRQVAVLNNSVNAANFFTLRSESVTQSSALVTPQSAFYPFATANLGVNIRLFESKKTSYEIMPFYNYPLQEFSGYGEKLGMFGASFKVNFQTIQKK